MSVWIYVILAAIALIFFARILWRWQPDSGDASRKLSDSTLIERVKLAVNPEFPNWVLFSNGTYVIVEGETSASDARAYALEQIREFGPVRAGSPAADFSVSWLHRTEGWSVGGHGHGMYTYVHPSELKSWWPSDLKIGLHGRSKRDADARECQIVYVSSSN